MKKGIIPKKPLNSVKKISTLFSFIALAGFGYTQNVSANVELVSLNLSAAGFGGSVIPGTYNTNYTYPDESYFKSWSERGIKMIRFPILWERMQTSAFAPLDKNQVALLKQTLDYAEKYKISVIVDVHNYGRYYGKIIGQEVSYESYVDFMGRLVSTFNSHNSVIGWDIMNEPHDMPEGNWPKAAQLAINKIRTIDSSRYIFVEGEAWASSAEWQTYNSGLATLQDPSNRLVFEAHTYFDEGGGGQYASSNMANFDSEVGVVRVKPFVEWLKANNLRGYIGEFGIPDTDPRWNAAMSKMLTYLSANCIPASYWAAGPWWGNYSLAIEPIDGKERPQWTTLKGFVGASCSDFGPNATKTSSATNPVADAPVEVIKAATYAQPKNLSGDDWTNGISKKYAAFSINNTTANKMSFVKGAYVKFANNEIRQIQKAFENGTYYNVYLDGAILDGNKVGYPNLIYISDGKEEPVPPTTDVSMQPVNLSDGNWLNGISRRWNVFFVEATSFNESTLVAGKYVQFSNGEVRQIEKVQYNGTKYLNVYFTGSGLDGNSVGYPNTITVKDKIPEASISVLYTSELFNVTDWNWKKGVATRWAGFFVANTPENKAQFKLGNLVRYSNGEYRKVGYVSESEQYLNIYTVGEALDGDVVGYPNKVQVINYK